MGYDDGEIPYPGGFPTRIILIANCREYTRVKRKKGPDQFWSRDYQTIGMIIKRVRNPPNKEAVKKAIIKHKGFLDTKTAAMLGERPGLQPNARPLRPAATTSSQLPGKACLPHALAPPLPAPPVPASHRGPDQAAAGAGHRAPEHKLETPTRGQRQVCRSPGESGSAPAASDAAEQHASPGARGGALRRPDATPGETPKGNDPGEVSNRTGSGYATHQALMPEWQAELLAQGSRRTTTQLPLRRIVPPPPDPEDGFQTSQPLQSPTATDTAAGCPTMPQGSDSMPSPLSIQWDRIGAAYEDLVGQMGRLQNQQCESETERRRVTVEEIRFATERDDLQRVLELQSAARGEFAELQQARLQVQNELQALDAQQNELKRQRLQVEAGLGCMQEELSKVADSWMGPGVCSAARSDDMIVGQSSGSDGPCVATRPGLVQNLREQHTAAQYQAHLLERFGPQWMAEWRIRKSTKNVFKKVKKDKKARADGFKDDWDRKCQRQQQLR